MRARGIKPGFFTDEAVVDLSPWARLLFVGLWCVADRAGRLLDKPKQLKIQLFPCDNVDVDKMLDEIAAAGLITRYPAQEERFIEVVNFTKHQSPHVKEAESTIPAPDKPGAKRSRSDTSVGGTILTPDSGLLTADSGLLTPELSEGSAASGDSPVDNSGAEDAFADVDFGEEEQKPETTCKELVSFYASETKCRTRSAPPQKATDRVAGIIAERLKAGRDPDLIRAAIRKLMTEGKDPSLLKTLIEEAFQTAPRSTFAPGASPPAPAEVAASAEAARTSRAAFEASKQAVAP